VLLVDSEQLDEEHHASFFSQPMFIAPLRDGLVEVGRFVSVPATPAWM
jgi:hypothetical protein